MKDEIRAAIRKMKLGSISMELIKALETMELIKSKHYSMISMTQI